LKFVQHAHKQRSWKQLGSATFIPAVEGNTAA